MAYVHNHHVAFFTLTPSYLQWHEEQLLQNHWTTMGLSGPPRQAHPDTHTQIQFKFDLTYIVHHKGRICRVLYLDELWDVVGVQQVPDASVDVS